MVRMFTERINWVRKIYLECGCRVPSHWNYRKSENYSISPVSASCPTDSEVLPLPHPCATVVFYSTTWGKAATYRILKP